MIFLLPHIGSLILTIQSEETMLQVVTFMDSGMKSNSILMGPVQHQISVQWVCLWENQETMSRTLMLDLVSESSNFQQENIHALILSYTILKILTHIILPLSLYSITTHYGKMKNVVSSVNSLDTQQLRTSKLLTAKKVVCNSIKLITPNNSLLLKTV